MMTKSKPRDGRGGQRLDDRAITKVGGSKAEYIAALRDLRRQVTPGSARTAGKVETSPQRPARVQNAWILDFANIGRVSGQPAPPVFRAKQSRRLGRYEGFHPRRKHVVIPIGTAADPHFKRQAEYVVQGGRRWFRFSPEGALHPAPMQPAITLETLAAFVRERGLYDPRTVWPTGDDPPGIRDRFLWLDEELRGERKVDVALSELHTVPEEVAQRILDRLEYLRHDVRHLLLWVLSRRDEDVLDDAALNPDMPFPPSRRPTLNAELLDHIGTSSGSTERPFLRVDETTGCFSYWGLGHWPQIIHAEMLNTLLERSWWPRLQICGWCGRFFLRPPQGRRGRPPDFDSVACQKAFSSYGPGEPHW